MAYVCKNGNINHCGYFEDEEDAAKARDNKALLLHGEFGVLNFPPLA
jgi:hypothetical protein